MKFKSELKELENNIQEVLYFCEVTRKTQLQTIEVLELLFDHYKSWKVDEFFEWDYYEKYIERLEFIRQISSGTIYPNDSETILI